MEEQDHRQFVRDSLTRIETNLTNQIELSKDHEERLRVVEKKINWFAGIGAAALAVVKFFGGSK